MEQSSFSAFRNIVTLHLGFYWWRWHWETLRTKLWLNVPLNNTCFSTHTALNSVPLTPVEGTGYLTNQVAFVSSPVSFFLFMRFVLNNLVDTNFFWLMKKPFSYLLDIEGLYSLFKCQLSRSWVTKYTNKNYSVKKN